MQIKTKHRLLLNHLSEVFPNIKFGIEFTDIKRSSILRYWKPKTISNKKVLSGIQSFVGDQTKLMIKIEEEITCFDTGKKMDYFKVELFKYDGNESSGNIRSD